MATVTGLPDLKADLAAIPGKLRVRALRNALAAGARVVQKAVRHATPVLNLARRGNQAAYRKGYRKPGTVQKAISVRNSKASKARGNVGVFVNVRPAKKGQRGAKNWRDPFYWRFLYLGTSKMRPVKFLDAGVRFLDDALRIFSAKIGPAIAKLNRPKAPAP
jgi:HK97 gp10 family phage protein